MVTPHNSVVHSVRLKQSDAQLLYKYLTLLIAHVVSNIAHLLDIPIHIRFRINHFSSFFNADDSPICLKCIMFSG